VSGTDLSWFKPVSAQEKFIRTFGKETVYAGGVGSGKTLSGAIKCLYATMKWPGGVGLVGRQTYRALEDTTKKVMLYGDDKPAIFGPELGSYIAGDDKFKMIDGSEILFRSLEDHNIEKLLSLNLSWVYVDELTETTLKVWLTLMGRLRHPSGPRAAWGTTNPNGHDFVWKRFHPDAGVTDPNRSLFIQPTEANTHLSRDYVAHLRTMPREWQKRFLDASFDTASGMIWDMWNSQVHAYDHETVGRLPPSWKRFESMDHGRRNPTAWLWWTVDPDGFLIVEDEYYVEGLLPSQHAPAIRAQRQMVAPNIRWGGVIAPPDTFRAAHDGRTVAQEYQEAAEILLIQGNDNVDAGLLRVSEWMSRDKSLEFPDWHPFARTLGPDGLGSPRVFVSRRCANLIGEIPDYRWKDLSPTQERDRDQPEQPRKKDDHAVDAFRYGIMSRPRPYTQITDERMARRVERAPRARAESAGLIDKVF
jgi:hypothetical protein